MRLARPLASADIARIVRGEMHGPAHMVLGIASLDTAGSGELAFHDRGDPGGAAVLLTRTAIEGRTCVVVDDPLAALCDLLEHVAPEKHDGAVERDGVRVHPGVVWPRGCEVGAGTILYANVVLYPGTKVGQRCRIHAGTVLGSPGFRHHRGRAVPHVGGVRIGDDVHIGANCTVDRGLLDDTFIGDRSKLDDQVHVGHNVRLGRDVVVAAQTGISGSVVVGDGTVIGGQVGIADHARLGRDVLVGAQSGVHGKVPDGERVLGTPARPIAQMRRIYAALKYLPDVVRKRD